MSSIKQTGMSAAGLAQLSGDTLKTIYGMNDDVVLYWAHHEKLCLIDGKTAFMGGLDLCYGRWDTNQHSISDAHPEDLGRIVFPGQDYNNARIMDFSDVSHWDQNKLDRRYNSRMGWSDVALCTKGPVVEDLKAHFVQRWNFIYYEKYDVRNQVRYQPLVYKPMRVGIIGHPYNTQGGDAGDAENEIDGQYHGFRMKMKEQFDTGRQRLEAGLREEFFGEAEHLPSGPLGGVHCQIVRSCAKWSHGVAVEHSIANAYIEVIRNSQHFVYMENQFFITATCDKQKPITNLVGAAIVERALRAARNNEDWHMIINIPSVPAFAGDLKADGSLGTRAIMEFQYNSINRGGHSIMETIAREGVDPMKYIRFYNLRSYDRINTNAAMSKVEQQAGVSYDDARKGYVSVVAKTLPCTEDCRTNFLLNRIKNMVTLLTPKSTDNSTPRTPKATRMHSIGIRTQHSKFVEAILAVGIQLQSAICSMVLISVLFLGKARLKLRWTRSCLRSFTSTLSFLLRTTESCSAGLLI